MTDLTTTILSILAIILKVYLIIIGVGLVVYFIFVGFLLWGIWWLIRKKPALALFLLLVLIALGTAEVMTPASITLGVGTLVSAVLMLITQYGRLKKGLKRRRK